MLSLKMLAFNTSTAMCSVALLIDGIITERCILIPYQHEKNILSMIDCLLLEADCTLQSLDCLVVCRGPGSFVGVRIGISLAQGLALGANLPLIEVSSLEVLAQGIWRLIQAPQVLAVIGAGLGELYLACYHRDEIDDLWLGKDTESIVTIEDMLILISKLRGEWVLVGQGWEYPVLLSKSILQISTRKILFPLAKDMLSIAVESWKNGDILSVDQVEPVYFRSKRL
ncbi:tRNA (adenosine(37)-N6)-threonylcarbamoyltransferase complex dimerization subunit type 1 TsaB [Blochmannia endosymbiont of Polyrhachis (Hedomyrma) turneri]|uniref:tRNA (adenosine(37)-N6)-threonylcarbamoyltransferase complex dimerization subunit type 1 TsaB n=1 Tax=Blochmannia endosymbiont of Polyrhachis (Hedomyrma) turneri TaxID=1505596 RepID=UPI00061A646C|nr:tRNA (adenosine(37)-N6)-threonylcarbamoyltransferase complex dimerization subunit type 1 TsaB [Blochmannia endosymbiont of Polyrhachis (Hedomyrma) turneri]AKC60006.1 tRNA threonylcarbamoyladenosine biosynthesis protein [Blochmannia endosymbiont of Polyrhachis (Hedomyrma) turneri]